MCDLNFNKSLFSIYEEWVQNINSLSGLLKK